MVPRTKADLQISDEVPEATHHVHGYDQHASQLKQYHCGRKNCIVNTCIEAWWTPIHR